MAFGRIRENENKGSVIFIFCWDSDVDEITMFDCSYKSYFLQHFRLFPCGLLLQINICSMKRELSLTFFSDLGFDTLPIILC